MSTRSEEGATSKTERNLEQDKYPVEEYFVCNACGHVVTREPPEYCQVCGAVRKAFQMVI